MSVPPEQEQNPVEIETAAPLQSVEPVAAETAADEPTVQEPTVQQPTRHEPAVHEPVVQLPEPELDAAAPTPVIETAVAQTPVIETAVTQTAVTPTVVAESVAAPLQPTVQAAIHDTLQETVVADRPAPAIPDIRVAPEAPLAAAAGATAPLLEMPLQLLNQLLAKVGATPLSSLAELLPALRLLSLIVVAGVTIKLTGATLGAIHELPLLGRLLELVGLISALQFLASNALKSQKRAELLARIQKLKNDILG